MLKKSRLTVFKISHRKTSKSWGSRYRRGEQKKRVEQEEPRREREEKND